MKKRILSTLFLFAALLNMAAQNPAKVGKPSGKTYPNWSRKAVCYIMEASNLTINSLDDGVMTNLVTNVDDSNKNNSVVYYDLMGCQMTSPQKGFYIKEVRNKSGKVLRTKHLQR